VVKAESAKSKTFVKILLLITLILFYSATLYAEATGPLLKKGTKQCGINFGYGYSLESSSDLRFASIYPYFGKVMTDPVGQGWLRGNIEGIVEGAFSYVHKNQNTYSAGVNLLARYNFLLSSKKWRPYIQGGFGILYTNLSLPEFGTSFNFASNAASGMQYFFNQENSINLELRYFHFSNAGLDPDNRGLNMLNIFIGFSHIF
jgi:hypothetical protein